MTLTIYQVDAFTDKLFGGNPAAVIPLTAWLSDELMQKIASENNLSETVYYIKTEVENKFHIRWFTPVSEVKLCGHATLATAFILFNIENFKGNVILFDSLSGILKVTQNNDWITLDFPVQETTLANAPEGLLAGLGKNPVEIYRASDDYMLVYQSQKEIEEMLPDFSLLKRISARGIIITAKATTNHIDFVSRFFAPSEGINEDPVTGSAHTKLVPYWAKKLGKTTLIAEQISERKGYLKCELKGDRVLMSGQGKLYLKGEVYL